MVTGERCADEEHQGNHRAAMFEGANKPAIGQRPGQNIVRPYLVAAGRGNAWDSPFVLLHCQLNSNRCRTPIRHSREGGIHNLFGWLKTLDPGFRRGDKRDINILKFC